MKKAFTMLELVFVIVVIGILAAAIIPSTRTNPVQEAAIQLLSHVRYTQHLAMVDDKYDAANVNWYEDRWQMRFNGNQYSIVSDNNVTFAVDPSNSGTNLSNIDLNTKYGTTISLAGTECAGQTIISFDHLGRPLVGNLAVGQAYANGQLVQGANNTGCNITLTNGTENATINIQRETGYASITF